MTAGVPPDPVAQPVEVHPTEPARFQYTVLGAGNVMPVLPPQSPARVGDAPDAAPARIMSRKSQSAAEMALTVRVRGVPMMPDCKKMRRTADAPAQVSVPLMVWLAEKETVIIPADDGAVIDKLFAVSGFEDEKFIDVLVVEVNEISPNVKFPP